MLKSVENCLKEIAQKEEEIYTESHYDEISSKIYDAYYNRINFSKKNNKRVSNNLKSDDEKILCLACGTGKSIEYINNNYNVSKILGIDYSENMIELAKERISSSNVSLQKGDFTDLSGINEKFDFVYMLGNPINHYRDNIMKEILQQVSNVLDEDGRFLYDIISYNGWKEENLHIHNVMYDNFEIIRAGCGFDTKKKSYYESNTYMTYLIKDLQRDNSNKVHIENLDLYSHSEENHRKYLSDYNFTVSKEEDRKIFLVSY